MADNTTRKRLSPTGRLPCGPNLQSIPIPLTPPEKAVVEVVREVMRELFGSITEVNK
jgi:hypothetical protein